MDHLEAYLTLARKRPDLFKNPAGGTTILLDERDIHEVEAAMAQQLRTHSLPSEWSRVGIAYQDQYLLLLRDAVRFPDGIRGTYIRFVTNDPYAPGVIIFPLYQGQVILEYHFRHASRSWHLELPRGFGDPTLSDEENARRELVEEIGATITRLASLGRVHVDTGMNMAYNHFFYAEVASYGNYDVHEGISELRLVSLAEFERLLRENVITDSFTHIAYARAKLQGVF